MFPRTAALLASALAADNRVAALTPSPRNGCCTGGVLSIGMIPYDYEPFVKYNGMMSTPEGDKPQFSGFLPSFLNYLSLDMGFTLEWVLVPCVPDATFLDCLKEQVSSGTVDMAYNSAAVVSSVDFSLTQPLFESTEVILVHKIPKGSGWWQLFEPFTQELWLGVVMTILFASLVMVVMEFIEAEDRREACSVDLLIKAIYHSWAAVLGGDDFEWTHWPGRVFRVGLLFVVLVLCATYTANLAAFLTMPAYELVGPQDADALSRSTVCVLAPRGEYLTRYMGNIMVAPTSAQTTLETRLEYCREQVINGRADAMSDISPVLKTYMLHHCDDLALVPSVEFAPMRFVLFFANHRDVLVKNLSAAIMHGVASPEYNNAIDLMNVERECPKADESDKITLESMIGLFIIFTAASVCALFAALVQRFQPHRRTGGQRSEDKLASESDMLRVLLGKFNDLEAKIASGAPSGQNAVLERLNNLETRLMPAELKVRSTSALRAFV